MIETRFCKDCKHCVLKLDGSLRDPLEYAKCAKAANVKIDLVKGSEHVDMAYCSTCRNTELPSYCGPSGLFFEPKGSS